MASASATPENKLSAQRRKSCDTVCSSNSSCFLHKRKPVHPLATSIRSYVSKSSNNVVKQRVLSARLLKLRSVQNQLNDANFHLAELQQENRALRNLQTRQDKALSKYEGTNADLPRLLRSHEEEIRALSSKNKTLRKGLKDVTDQLKTKDDELASVREQLKNLSALTKSRNLGERQALAEQVDDLKFKLKSSDDQINLLNRKLLVETKNYKYKLNGEVSKNKQTQRELSQALTEIDKLTSLLEGKNRFSLLSKKRFANVNHHQSTSLVSLTSDKRTKDVNRSIEIKMNDARVSFDNDDEQSERSDVKLEPISSDKDLRSSTSLSDVMSSPSENIKARLSSQPNNSDETEQVQKSFEKISVAENNAKTDPLGLQKSRPSSSQKLDRLENHLSFLKNSEAADKIEHKFDEYHNEILSTINDYAAVVDKHKEEYQNSKTETEKLLENLRETDTLNSKLRHADFLSKEPFEISPKDVELVNKIWEDEYAFRSKIEAPDKKSRNTDSDETRSKGIDVDFSESEDGLDERVETATDYDRLIKSDRNGNVIKKGSEVTLNDKSKLLAALRAIDNGEDVETEFRMDRTSRLFDDFFGGIHK